MKYEIYKQFPEKIKDYNQAYKKLNKYLLEQGIANHLALPRFDVENVRIRGKIEENIEFYAELSSTSFSSLRKAKSELYGGIFFKNSDKEITKKAKNLARLLIDYEL